MKEDNDAHPSWLERLTHALLREPQDRKQLIEVLHDAKDRHLLDADALTMIEGVLNVSEMKVRDVMVPRPQMVVVEEDTDPKAALPTVVRSGHSRFPVIGESRDQIVGILLAKDLLKTNEGTNTIHDLLRPATFIPESKRLDVLLKEFRLNRNHMAIVVDEYGGIAGLVTIEDVLEQIVGDIVDEYDSAEQEPFIKQLSDLEYSVKALTPIDEFNEYFNTDYSHEDFDTVGGLILHKFSHFPKPGETISFDDFKIKIIHASSRGIQLIKVTRILRGHS
ncbi:MAG: CBS domain-containing protein [Coxiellaceae bacterium]|nr:CBS domain-containing protein [Coxiellaceae bacterium]